METVEDPLKLENTKYLITLMRAQNVRLHLHKKSLLMPDKYVKASAQIDRYGLTGSDRVITGDIGNGINFNFVKDDEVPHKTKTKLMKAAQELAKKLEEEHKNKPVADGEAGAENAEDVKNEETVTADA